MVAIEDSLVTENAHVELLKQDLATEVEKKQQLLDARCWTSQTMSRQLAKGDNPVSGRQSNLEAIPAERDKCFNVATEATDKLKVAETDIAMPSTLQEATREKMDFHVGKIAELQGQLTATDAELFQLSAMYRERAEMLNRVKSQSVAAPTVLDYRKSVAVDCERPNKRAGVEAQCEELSTTSSTAAFSALLADPEDYKNFCESLTIRNQLNSRLASETKNCARSWPTLEKSPLRRRPRQRGEKSVLRLPISVRLPSRRSPLVSWLYICDWRGFLLALRRTLLGREQTCRMLRHAQSRMSRKQRWLEMT